MFIPDFVEIIKPLQKIIKKRVEFRWTSVKKKTFKKIKATIVFSPTLHNPYFSKDFSLYTVASDHSLDLVIMHNDKKGGE